MSNPTPRPWVKIYEEFPHRGLVIVNGKDAKGENPPAICVMFQDGKSAAEVDANADLITTAVNAHDELVAALGGMMTLAGSLAGGLGPHNTPLTEQPEWRDAVKALRLVKKGVDA